MATTTTATVQHAVKQFAGGQGEGECGRANLLGAEGEEYVSQWEIVSKVKGDANAWQAVTPGRAFWD